MEHSELDAPDAIRNSIKSFWYREMDFGPTPAAFEVLPDGHAEIIFHFGSGCNLIVNGQPQAMPSPYIVGLLGKPIYFQVQDSIQIVGIKCLPWAVYDLLGIDTVKGGVQKFTHPIAELQSPLSQLLQSGKVNEALILTREWFLNNYTMTTPSTITKAGLAMLTSNGSMPVSSVAAAAHSTVRTLERKFKASAGHTIKDVSGLIRFEQARDSLWDKPDISIVRLAHELGYADQSHFNREFKRYSGMTAAAFARQTKKRKKDFDGDFVAIVLSS